MEVRKFTVRRSRRNPGEYWVRAPDHPVFPRLSAPLDVQGRVMGTQAEARACADEFNASFRLPEEFDRLDHLPGYGS
jgi:hypothetical protein